MNLQDAKRLLGKRVAVNANGGSLVTGTLTAVCEVPSVTIETADGRRDSYAITAIDGWVSEGTPQRLGGDRVGAG